MKLTPEIKAIARAMFSRDWNGDFDNLREDGKIFYYKNARTALEVLRTPSNNMLDAALDGDWNPYDIYIAMIEEALGDNK